MCVFSTHNLIRDPPFSRLDLIVVPQPADLPGGRPPAPRREHLPLRAAARRLPVPRPVGERRGPARGCSARVDKKHRLSRAARRCAAHARAAAARSRRGRRTRAPLGRARPAARAAGDRRGARAHAARPLRAGLGDRQPAGRERLFLAARRDASSSRPSGAPSADVVGMARKGLRLDLRTAIHKAVKTAKTVVHERIAVETNGQVQHDQPGGAPAPELGQRAPVPGGVPGARLCPSRRQAERDGDTPELRRPPRAAARERAAHDQGAPAGDDRGGRDLERGAASPPTRSCCRSTRSCSRPTRSCRPPRRSCSRSTRSSRRSTTSCNKKVEELDSRQQRPAEPAAAAPRSRRCSSTASCASSASPSAATEVFRLIETDVGPPDPDIAPRFEGDICRRRSREVLRTLATKERQVSLADGSASYLMRVLPYRRLGERDRRPRAHLPRRDAAQPRARAAGAAVSIVESSQDAIVGRSFEGDDPDLEPGRRADVRLPGGGGDRAPDRT